MLFRKLWYTIRSCCYLWCRAYRRCTQLELFQLERLARGGPHRFKHGNPLVAEGYHKSVDCVTVWPSAGAPTTGWRRRCGLIARMQQVHQSSHLSALQCTARHDWLSELLACLAQSRDCAPLCQQTYHLCHIYHICHLCQIYHICFSYHICHTYRYPPSPLVNCVIPYLTSTSSACSN